MKLQEDGGSPIVTDILTLFSCLLLMLLMFEVKLKDCFHLIDKMLQFMELNLNVGRCEGSGGRFFLPNRNPYISYKKVQKSQLHQKILVKLYATNLPFNYLIGGGGIH